MTENTDDTIQNRSEIAFVIDAKDTNPNGDPLTADNEPRIDPVTGQCVVTDVRLKRYLHELVAEVPFESHVGDNALPGDRVDARLVVGGERVAVGVGVLGVDHEGDFGTDRKSVV